MGKKKSLSPTKRAKIITLFNDAKLCKREIARRQNVAESTVRLTIWKYYAAGLYRDARRSGQPLKLIVRDRRWILRAVESNRRLSSSELRNQMAIGEWEPHTHPGFADSLFVLDSVVESL